MDAITKSTLLNQCLGIDHGFTTKFLPKSELIALEEKSAYVKQVHKDHLLWTDKPEHRTREADAIATKTPYLPVGVYSADCTPILVAAYSEKKPIAVMAIHAGWRGTALRIAEKSILSFTQQLPKNIQLKVAIGPCIGREKFEVGEEVIESFAHAKGTELIEFIGEKEGKKKFLFDLEGENLRQIQTATTNIQIPVEIDALRHCTHTQEHKYPSFRREKENSGRIFSYISFQS